MKTYKNLFHTIVNLSQPVLSFLEMKATENLIHTIVTLSQPILSFLEMKATKNIFYFASLSIAPE